MFGSCSCCLVCFFSRPNNRPKKDLLAAATSSAECFKASHGMVDRLGGWKNGLFGGIGVA